MAKKETEKREPTPQDWDKIKTLYLQNYELDAIVKQLPEVHIAPVTILNKMRKEGMEKVKKQINERVINTMADELVKERKRTTEECVRAYRRGIDIINRLLADYKEEQQAGGTPKRCTAYNMDLLMAGINKIQKGFDTAFGEDKNGKLYEKEPDVFVIEGIDEKKL